MDERQLQEKVFSNRISACGYGAISATIVASKLLGAKKAELLSYYTSGDIIGDNYRVVGYAAAQTMWNKHLRPRYKALTGNDLGRIHWLRHTQRHNRICPS